MTISTMHVNGELSMHIYGNEKDLIALYTIRDFCRNKGLIAKIEFNERVGIYELIII